VLITSTLVRALRAKVIKLILTHSPQVSLHRRAD